MQEGVPEVGGVEPEEEAEQGLIVRMGGDRRALSGGQTLVQLPERHRMLDRLAEVRGLASKFQSWGGLAKARTAVCKFLGLLPGLAAFVF